MTGAVADVEEQIARRVAVPAKVTLLLHSERWATERRERWRRERLERLLAVARRTPYGRAHLPEGAPLSEMPLLERDTLRDRLADLRPPGERLFLRGLTSGSSGTPVHVELGPETLGFSAAVRLRMVSWFGLPPEFVPEAGLAIGDTPDDPPFRRLDGDPPRFLLNPFVLDPDAVAAAHDAMVAAGGVLQIGGMTSQVGAWARLYATSGRDGRALGAKVALLGGEMADVHDVSAIEATFGCAIAEMYGARESPIIASLCPEGSLHVNEEHVWLELLRPDGSPAAPGEHGEVVVTPLHNTELPLVRYRLRDAAALLPGPCACGRTLPRLSLSVGRTTELVRARDGGRLHPRALQSIYERLLGDDLLAFHTVQEGPGSFVAHVDLRRPRDGVAQGLEQGFAAYLREPVSVRLDPGGMRTAPKPPPHKRCQFTCRWNGGDHGAGGAR